MIAFISFIVRSVAPAFFTALLLASCSTPGRRLFLLDHLPKDSVKRLPVDLKEYEKKYAEYDGVYLLREYVVEHTQRAYMGGGRVAWDTYKMATFRYIVLNPDVEWLATFRVHLEAGEELNKVFITLIAPDGSVRQLDKGDLREERDSDGERTYKLAYPGIVKGSIVDVGYDIHYDSYQQPEFRHDIPLQFGVPCERLAVRYVYPSSWTVGTKRIDSAKGPFYRRISEPENNISIVSYDASDIPAITWQAYSPYTKEFAQYLDITLQAVKFGRADQQPLIPEDWPDYANEYKDYALDKGSPQSRAIRKQVEKIVEESDSPMEKMKKIVAWVQREIGIDWQFRNADFRSILKDKRGNPYLICGLTRAMLENVGIPSSLMLIHSAEEGYFDPTYLHWDVLHQAGVKAQIDGKTFYLFPWIKNYPVDQVPVYFQGQSALIIAPEGYGGFETIPYGSIAASKVESDYDVDINDEGLMRVTERREFSGEAAYELRRSLDGLKEEKLENEVKDLLSYEGGEVKLEKYEVQNLEDYSLPLVVRMVYTVDNMVTVTPDEAIVRSEGLFSPAALTGYKLDTAKRTNPIRIYYDEHYLKKIRLHLPKGWSLVDMPKPVAEKNRFGEIAATYTYADGLLIVDHTRALQRSSGTAAEIGELRAIIGKGSKLNVPTLVFKVE